MPGALQRAARARHVGTSELPPWRRASGRAAAAAWDAEAEPQAEGATEAETPEGGPSGEEELSPVGGSSSEASTRLPPWHRREARATGRGVRPGEAAATAAQAAQWSRELTQVEVALDALHGRQTLMQRGLVEVQETLAATLGAVHECQSLMQRAGTHSNHWSS